MILKPVRALALLGLIAACSSLWAKSATPSTDPLPLPLEPLAPGAIKPEGWLRDWATSAAEGITGDLDNRSATFAKGWTAVDFEATGVKPQGTGWPLEQCAYWLDGLVRLGYILEDPKLIAKAKSRLDPVVEGVLQQGESLIYWVPRDRLEDPFNNWAHSHMGRALVAYYRASGDPRVLDALRKVYREFELPDFQSDFAVVNGMVNADPMLETYKLTNDSRIRDQLLHAAQQPALRKAADEWSSGHVPPGHGVTYYEHIRVPALLSPLVKDRELLGSTEAAIEWGERNHLLPIGLVSSEEYVAGVGSTRNVETCNVAASTWTYHWMLRLTGSAAWGDRIERIFFNAGPAPISRDFQTLCYYQSPNRVSERLPLEEPGNPTLRGSYKFTPVGHSTLCCAASVNRFLPNYIAHMWMKRPDGLAATLHGPARVEEVVRGVSVKLTSHTNYPFEEKIRIEVSPERPVSFVIALRIPEWCKSASLRVNGRAERLRVDRHGFATVERTWANGDQLLLDLPMSPEIVHGRETPFPQLAYFREEPSRRISQKLDINSPYASVHLGPLLFALPIKDITPNEASADTNWKYALDAPSGHVAVDSIEVLRKPMARSWRWSLDAPVIVRVRAARFDWQPDEMNPLPPAPVIRTASNWIELVPYGTTKFRVSMFPVTDRLWDRLQKGNQPLATPGTD
jgi:uncharacterized protein